MERVKERCEARTLFKVSINFLAFSNLICIYFESINAIEIAIHSILNILERLLSEINDS